MPRLVFVNKRGHPPTVFWGAGNKALAIQCLVTVDGYRPRCPPGLRPLHADYIRRCLHAQPEMRPQVAELTE